MARVIDTLLAGRSAHPARKNARIHVYPEPFSGALMIEIRSELTRTDEMANAHVVLTDDDRVALIVALGGTA